MAYRKTNPAKHPKKNNKPGIEMKAQSNTSLPTWGEIIKKYSKALTEKWFPNVKQDLNLTKQV